jgi:pimeloyl-ACP methyl ester carboxylesterase
MVVTGHEYQVPLDHSRPGGEKIAVFAREVVAVEKEKQDLPWLIFFQGGPGMPSPRPSKPAGWLKRALQDYRVLLLDGRGTGNSTPLTFQTLARLPSAQEQADYLMHFRADAIVQDAEWIRHRLLGEGSCWSALGQSFGGFCLAHYLSVAPGSLREGIFTGGLPPLSRSPDEVYRATYRLVSDRNRRYYDRYPGDVDLVREIVSYLESRDVRLPGGGQLTPRRFLQLGIGFGYSDGFEKVHYLLESAFVGGGQDRELGYALLRSLESTLGFETNPIYAMLQEACYCQGEASNWSAERVRAEYPEFQRAPGRPIYFTGEMIYPWVFDDYEYLRPLKRAADILAAYDGWPRLYDLEVLQANTVPCAAAVYYDDMYVERPFSEETARQIPGLEPWITNEYDHDALRVDGERVLDRLLRMVRGEISGA